MVRWALLAFLVGVPLSFALSSPLLAWRQPVYVVAGAAGVVGLALLLVQPLLLTGDLPGPGPRIGRRLHRGVGVALVVAILIHVGGLWLTSPPDVIDALLFRSPTPFAPWGVVAMIAALMAAGLALLRRRLVLSPLAFRRVHGALAGIVVVGTVVHAVLIDGTMEQVSKVVLCLAVVAACIRLVMRLRFFR